jgi:hypothetical protein
MSSPLMNASAIAPQDAEATHFGAAMAGARLEETDRSTSVADVGDKLPKIG